MTSVAEDILFYIQSEENNYALIDIPFILFASASIYYTT